MPTCDVCDGMYVSHSDWVRHVQSDRHLDNEDRDRRVGQKSDASRQELQPRRETRSCHSCGQVGHISRDCSHRKETRKCNKCQQVGHIARNCPSSSGAGHGGMARYVKGEEDDRKPGPAAFVKPAPPHPNRNNTKPEVIVIEDETNIKNYKPAKGNLETYLQCPHCTFYNGSSASRCDVCDFRGLNRSHRVTTTTNATSSRWVCRYCKDQNPAASPSCIECRMPRDGNRGRGNGSGSGSRRQPSDVIDVDAPSYINVDDEGAWDPTSATYRDQMARVEQYQHNVAKSSVPVAPNVSRQAIKQQAVKKEEEEELCVYCQCDKPTHSFMPCGHTVLCQSCARTAESRTDRNCYICRRAFDRIVVGISSSAKNKSQAWVNAPSTFPWIGGELSSWDRFLSEVKAAAYQRLEQELASQWKRYQIEVTPCDWASVLGRFKDGWASLACPESTWSGVFGWHGAKTLANTMTIAKHGWHTATRNRNNHGAGEYFGLHHSQVFEYAREKHRHDKEHTLIYGFVLRGKHLSWVENFCLVVDNPTGDDADTTTFCLPIFTVRFPNAPKEKRWQIPKMPVRWSFGWENDENDNFIPYDWGLNKELNAMKGKLYAGILDSDDAADCEHTIRKTDDEGRNADYAIDVHRYTQTNKETNFQRRVECACMPPTTLPKTLWVSYNEAYHMPAAHGAAGAGATAGGGGGGAPRKEEVWMVLDLFVQRELTEGYFAYRPDELFRRQGGTPQRETRNSQRRYMEFTQFGKEEFFVDFESMKIHKGRISQFKRAKGGLAGLEGKMLAVVEA